MTEPQAGSDVKSLRTTAKLDGDEWVLNGTKVFITNGGIADVHVVVATVDPELGHRGQASFVIPKGTPGLEQGKKESKLGIRASHTAEVILEDCRIPVENLLGGMDKLERKLERARSGESTGRASNALATFELTRPDRRRVGARDRPGRVRVDPRPISTTAARRTRWGSTSTRARPPAGRRSSASAIQQRLPTWRRRSRRRACSSSARRGWAATACR